MFDQENKVKVQSPINHMVMVVSALDIRIYNIELHVNANTKPVGFLSGQYCGSNHASCIVRAQAS